MQTKESLPRIENVLGFSQEILEGSTDLIHLNFDGLDRVLVPRLEEFKLNREANKFLPAGSNLPLEQEVGMGLFLNVINFCYQDPESGHEYVFNSASGRGVRRSTGLATALAESGINWDNLVEVGQMTPARWAEVIQLSETNSFYLGAERGARLVQLARQLLAEGYPTVASFLAGCDFDATVLVGKLMESGLFDDQFLKRAQLAASTMNDVLVRRSEVGLTRIDQLTVMADYRIPQVFYNLGVVKIEDQALLEKLQNHVPLEAGGREELALRSTCVVVGWKIAERLGIMQAEADGLLWGLSQQMAKAGELDIPHMVVATDAY